MTSSTDGGSLMSTGLLKVAKRAQQYPEARFNSLAHLMDEEALGRAFRRIRKDAAVGVDGVTKEEYGQLVRAKLVEMLQIRVADPPFLRLLGKCLHVGVLDGEEFSEPGEGTAQGSIISPMLGNVYLHYLLDLWFEREVKPQLEGHARLVRYADDFVIGFAQGSDAVRVRELLQKRMAEFGLTWHPDKTRLIPFARPHVGKSGISEAGTFDFLGFTMYWSRTRRGGWRPGMKTRKARLQRALHNLGEWCRRHQHLPLKEQHAALTRRLRGHYQYFGVNGNIRSLRQLQHRLRQLWLKRLRRRSQRGRRLTWQRFSAYLEAHPLPRPRIYVQIWA